MRDGLDRAVPLVTMTADATGTWTWQLALNDHCVAVAARTYQRTADYVEGRFG